MLKKYSRWHTFCYKVKEYWAVIFELVDYFSFEIAEWIRNKTK
jgi:hypothetical protein